MVGKNFEVNMRGIEEIQRQVQQDLERQLNEQVRFVVSEVAADMDGRSPDDVYAVLVSRLTTAVPGLQVNEAELRVVAEAVSSGSLEP